MILQFVEREKKFFLVKNIVDQNTFIIILFKKISQSKFYKILQGGGNSSG